jgi:membrane protease YdiL (CAAX protease family)
LTAVSGKDQRLSSSSSEPSSNRSTSDGPPPVPAAGEFYRSAWVAYLVLAILGVLWLGFVRHEIPLAAFLDLGSWWLDVGYGLLGGGLLLVVWGVGRWLVADLRQVEDEIGRLIGPLQLSEAMALALISGFSEELFFRGAMQPALGWEWALVIFTLLHTGTRRSFLYWTAFAAIAGGLFAWLTLDRGNLLPAMIAHVTVNAVQLVRLSRQPRRVDEGGSPPI